MTSESLGMVEGQLRLVEYDDRWPGVFEELRGCLVRRLKHRVESVHHVGSTSVPGLAAKPILDVLVAVPDFEASLECVPLLAKLGFEYGPEDDVVDRHYFRGRRDGLRTHHLSLAEPTSRYFIDTLAFRDALRASPRLAAEYGGSTFLGLTSITARQTSYVRRWVGTDGGRRSRTWCAALRSDEP